MQCASNKKASGERHRGLGSVRQIEAATTTALTTIGITHFHALGAAHRDWGNTALETKRNKKKR
ncbi:hypothetical protein CGCSCA5_v010679 [Colletotrichum siamense]|nr:hypothetical protein CGCSCA5_v010679 [Colletotrichum siamense]KAF4880412.1 hypothetical protein CGCSCA1_v000029 [Colletotrichum siamense]